VFASALRAPFPLDGDVTPIPATLCSFAAAAALYGAFAYGLRIVSRRA
jgi:hypothetical protein